MSIVLGDRYTVDLFKLMGFNGRAFTDAKELYEYILKILIYIKYFLFHQTSLDSSEKS